MDINVSHSQSKRVNRKATGFSISPVAIGNHKRNSEKKKVFCFKNKNTKQLPSISLELSKSELKSFFRALRKMKEISVTQCHVMLTLLDLWGSKGLFPNYQTIAEEADVSLSTSKRTLKEMRARGFVDWINKWIGKTQSANEYFFTITKEFFEEIIFKFKNKISQIKEKRALKNRPFLRVSERNSNYNYNKYNYKNTELPLKKEQEKSSLEDSLKKLTQLVRSKTENIRERVRKKQHRLLQKDLSLGKKFLRRIGNLEDYIEFEKIELCLDALLQQQN